MNPKFLRLDEVLALHGRSIDLFGGRLGLRDLGLLQSALAMPQASFEGEWLHPTHHEMAAAYLFHICKNHPFLDGNKPTGTAAALVFLEINGLELRLSHHDKLTNLVLGVAASQVSKAEVAVFFEKHSRRKKR